MFQRTDKMKISPGKSQEKVLAQVERILNLFPTSLNKRRSLNSNYMLRNMRLLAKLEGLCKQMEFPKSTLERVDHLFNITEQYAIAEEKAWTKAASAGLEKLANTFGDILKRKDQ